MQPENARTVQVRPVEPLSFVAEASEVLRAAWRPPCLHYTAEYLRFQFGFPNSLAPIGVAAWQNSIPVGFVGAAGRRTNVGDVYLSSFLSLRPGTVSSVALALVRTEAREVLKRGRPMLVFAEVGSVGEYLLRELEILGLTKCQIGEYRVHAALPDRAPEGYVVEGVTADEWSVAADRMRDDTLLLPSFDSATLAQFAASPGGRRFLVVTRQGVPLAVAMHGVTEMSTFSGACHTPALHYVRMAEEDPDALVALLGAAKQNTDTVVSVPNTVGISPDVARAARLRATGAVFAAYICPNHCSIPPLRGTEFEIV